jgi:DNA-binding transcriptional LysR family regulator
MSNLPQAHWLNSAVSETGGSSPQVFVNDADAILSCIRSGIGKSLLPEAIGNADSSLIRIDGFRDLPARELWLLLHPDIRTFKRAIAVVDWVKGATRMLK